MQLLQKYRDQRREIVPARKHPYFFVVHKPGPTFGRPLSMSGLNAIFRAINDADLGISHLSAHVLRYFSGTSLADFQLEEGDPTQQTRETHRRVRNTLAGRRPDSNVDATYTENATRREAERVSIQHQEAIEASDPNREARLDRIAEQFKKEKK
jgi:hypothetical protein